MTDYCAVRVLGECYEYAVTDYCTVRVLGDYCTVRVLGICCESPLRCESASDRAMSVPTGLF